MYWDWTTGSLAAHDEEAGEIIIHSHTSGGGGGEEEEDDDEEEEPEPEDTGGGGGGGEEEPDPEIEQLYNEVRSSGRTSRGESLDDQDEETRRMFEGTWGESASQRWAQERESTYYPDTEQFSMPSRSRTATMDREVTPRSSGPGTMQDGREYTPQSSGQATSDDFAQARQQLQPMPVQQPTVPEVMADVPFRPTAPISEPARVNAQQAVANQAAATAAVEAKAAGATDEQAIVTSTVAATAAALALDRRSLVGESQETQRQFRENFGERAPDEWAKQHNLELERNQVIYGTPEPRAGTMPINPAMPAPPAPDRRIGAPVAATVGPVAPGAPAVRPPVSAGGAPTAPSVPAVPGAAPVTTPAGAAPSATAMPAPTTPVDLALAADRRDVPPFNASPLGQLVNEDDPIAAVTAFSLPNAVRNGQVDPEFAQNVARAIAADGPDARGYLDPIARMAWYRERVSKGERPEAPEMAPDEYVTGWQGMWRSGGTAPLTTALGENLHKRGLMTPAEARARGAGRPAGRDIEGDYAPGPPPLRAGAVERPTGAVERPDTEAAPIVDAEGNVVPNPVSVRPPAMAPGPSAVSQSGAEPSTMFAGVSESSFSPEQIDQAQQGYSLQYGPTPGELRAPPMSEQARDQSYLERLPLLTQAYRQADTPLDAVTRVMLATQAGSAALVEPGGDKLASTHLAHAIAKGDGWASTALEDVARLAWARENRADPSKATDEYVASWIGAWKAGDDVPLARELDQQLADTGVKLIPGVMQSNWQEKYGEGLGFNQSEFARSGVMSSAEAASACGPAALVSFQRAAGRNPTPAEAARLARESGWSTAGMRGTAHMAQLLRTADLDVSDPERIDFTKVNASIDQGKPVIFDTTGGPSVGAGHYFVVYGRNEKTGQYLVGGSGEALSRLGGKSWMSVSDIVRTGVGSPRNAIYMNDSRFLAAPGRPMPTPRAETTQTAAPAPVAPDGVTNVAMAPSDAGNVYSYQGPVDEKSDRATNGTSPDEIEDYIRRAASTRGIDPDQAYAVARYEGSLNNQRVYNPVLRAANGQPSWGPFQLHVEGAHLGDAYIRDTRNQLSAGLHPRDPKGWKLAVDYALDTVAKDGNWKQWYAADRALKGGRYTPVKAKPIGFTDEALRYAGLTRRPRQ